MKNAFKSIDRILSSIVILFISIYQKTFSPDHGPMKHTHEFPICKFHPTCSEYSKGAFKKFGFFKGLGLSAKRVVKCVPWKEFTVDPLPR